MLTRAPLALLLPLAVLSLAAGQDRDDKKSKIPPLVFMGEILGEVNYVDSASDKLVVLVKDRVREAVRTNGPGRLMNGGVQYVVKEVMVQKSYNLSPDVKIRLLNKQPEPAKKDTKSKQDAKKKTASKTTKKDADASKEGEGDKEKADKEKAEKEKADKEKMDAEEKPEKDPDAKLGGAPGKKSQLAKGQVVRVALGRNNDPVNPQIYVMAVYVLSDGK